MLNVLITRPTNKAKALETSLTALGIACVNQPLFDYKTKDDAEISQRLLTHGHIIIFVSVAAVEFANNVFPANYWQYQSVFAVGNATKLALERLGITPVFCPTQENSEGLLALPALNKSFNNAPITIVRGDRGREHLASQLRELGANVNYLESYQCVWRTFTKDIAQQWFKQQINCIVVTSNAILEKLVQLMLPQQEAKHTGQLTKYWQNECLWLVASHRIAESAKSLGLSQVIVSDGASEKAIITTLKQLEEEKLRCSI
ncbi:uroporphyrinogen-III synthase [Colwellia sp. MSW7]|uniref:Uroporphyrinogen-III synthase n=1 Tax=Colwellia maritima TaxID=2912588 RepID=A0ABS9WWN2_9GAMM|nr:uroporphyrinogen-III synthase [Colwellia maritima]MCI2282280.1 uroporphyrinogen-III synthase [Colwellia maritima]